MMNNITFGQLLEVLDPKTVIAVWLKTNERPANRYVFEWLTTKQVDPSKAIFNKKVKEFLYMTQEKRLNILLTD